MIFETALYYFFCVLHILPGLALQYWSRAEKYSLYKNIIYVLYFSVMIYKIMMRVKFCYLSSSDNIYLKYNIMIKLLYITNFIIITSLYLNLILFLIIMIIYLLSYIMHLQIHIAIYLSCNVLCYENVPFLYTLNNFLYLLYIKQDNI